MDYFVQKYKDWKFHSQFQEILPDDMDDEYMFSEKQSIRDSARSLKKYGSLGSNLKRTNETLLRHEIEKTDTLQGIALKYGCTTEQIRRTNRLFASDSLFLRQFLLVPVDKSSPYYAKAVEDSNAAVLVETGNSPETPQTPSEPSTASAASSHGSARPSNGLPPRPYSIAGDVLHLQNGVCGSADDEVNHNHRDAVTNGGASGKQSKSLDSVMALSPEEENRKCINDFLSKIDSTISESRKYVEKSKEMITSQSDDGLFVSVDVVQRRRNNHLNNSYKQEHYQAGNQQQQQQHMRQSSTGSSSDMSYLLNTTQTRRVQNSLKRLEKQQDDFFEL